MAKTDPKLEAREGLKKVATWLVKSGALLTFLNALQASLVSLQAKEIKLDTFLIGLVFTVAFMLVNASVYYVTKLNE